CSSRRRRSTACRRSSPLPGGPPRAHLPALFPSESHTHLLVWFSRDQGYRGSVDPDWSRPPRSVFHDPEFHESRGSDYLQVLSSDHRVSHTAAIVFDGSQVPFLDDVRDDESSAWLEDPERLCKYGRLVGAQIDDAVTQDHVGLCVGEGESFDWREDERSVPDIVRCRRGRCARNHRRSHVDPGGASSRTDKAAGQEHVDSAAASQVDDGLARPESRVSHRISTSKPEHRFGWDSRELRRRISDRTARVVLARSAAGRRDRVALTHFRTDCRFVISHGIYYRTVVANIKYSPSLGLPDVGSQGAGKRPSPVNTRTLGRENSQYAPRSRVLWLRRGRILRAGPGQRCDRGRSGRQDWNPGF